MSRTAGDGACARLPAAPPACVPLRRSAPACDEAAWVFAGLSMAGWNAVISLGLAVLSVVAALRERAKR